MITPWRLLLPFVAVPILVVALLWCRRALATDAVRSLCPALLHELCPYWARVPGQVGKTASPLHL